MIHWNKLFFVLILCLTTTSCFSQSKLIYYTNSGNVLFESKSYNENIKAKSNELRGLLNDHSKSFAFSVRIASFDGFNMALQKEHFNENYMESSKYPNAIFYGTIIDELDLNKEGVVNIRAKGKLKIHGQEQEKIIKIMLTKADGTIAIQTHFKILLNDYNIRIPRIVHEKVSGEIEVEVNAELVKK